MIDHTGRAVARRATASRPGWCAAPDPLLPNGTPQQFVEAVYPRYASPSGLGGPFGSEASLREFFTLELGSWRARQAAVLSQKFRVAPVDCKTAREPFIPTEHN